MTENLLHNGQFEIDPKNVLLALLASVVVGNALTAEEAVAVAALFPAFLSALSYRRK
jgi:hypothetical protein